MAKKKKMVTMRDVADRVGCTPRVISAILNSEEGDRIHYSDKLAKATQKAVKDLGYIHKRRTQPKAGNRKILFVFTFGVQEDFTRLMTSNITSVCKSLNLESLVYFCHWDGGETSDIEDFIEKWNVDGVMVIHHINSEVLSLLESRKLPVLFYNPVKELPENSIFFDDQGAAEKLFSLLSALKIDNAAYIRRGKHPDPSEHFSQAIRREATRENAARHNIDLCCELESKNILNQVMELDKACAKHDRVMVLAYADLKSYQDFFLGQNFLLPNAVYPNKIDFFSYDHDHEMAFAYVKYPRESAIRQGLERLALMIETKTMTVENQVFNGEIVVKRTPFQIT